jgi:Fe-S-cluster-containing dehydrogenase component
MPVNSIFIDASRCIGCRACEAACRECDTHKGESMIMVDYVDRGLSVATQPTVCMHCERPGRSLRAGLSRPGDLDHGRGGGPLR